MKEIRRLILQMAENNPTWGYSRIQGDCQDGFLMAKRFLIIDRDGLFSPKFKAILESSGVEILLTA